MVDCIPEIKQSEYFNRAWHNKMVSKHLLLNCSLELTYNCNLNCSHCYIDKSERVSTSVRNELNKDEIKDILDQAVSEGLLSLLITGGEPLLRKDFKDIYLYAKKKGLFITIFTNGTLITPKMTDFFAEWPPLSIEITLYGASEKVYESVTGIKGSFAKCMRAIDLLFERKIPFELKSVILTKNKKELNDMKAIAEEKGVRYRFDAVLNPTLSGSKSPRALSLTPKKIVDLDIQDAKTFNSLKKNAKKLIGKPADSSLVYFCGAGRDNIHINPYGEISTCIMARKPKYDLRSGKLKEGWHEFIPSAISQKRQFYYQCQECEIGCICSQCPGWAQLEHNDQEKPVEYLCKIANLRAEALGLEERAPVMKEIEILKRGETCENTKSR